MTTDWSQWIGRTQKQSDALTPQILSRFRATLDSNSANDQDPKVAPQGIHWCLCLPDAATAELGEDGHPRRTDTPDSFLPPIPLARRMWASSTVEFLAPLHRGEVIERISTIADIAEKSGSTGALVFVSIEHETHADGMLAVRERQTVVYRAAATEPPAPCPANTQPDLSDWQWHHQLMPSEPLLFRYSSLTFNSHRIHYDVPYAVDEERYRGLVVQGPLTATLLLDLAAQELGHNTLTKFAFQGKSPAFAGEPLHLVGRAEGSVVTLAALGGDGRQVMKATAEAG